MRCLEATMLLIIIGPVMELLLKKKFKKIKKKPTKTFFSRLFQNECTISYLKKNFFGTLGDSRKPQFFNVFLPIVFCFLSLIT